MKPTIRPITPDDAPAVLAVAIEAGLFLSTETEVLDTMLADHFEGRGDGQICVLVAEGETCGVAYYAPAPAADRAWYLTMIAVRSHFQGKGMGTALMSHIESELRAGGQRILLVETSGLPEFEGARAFYAKCGFQNEARIRDFYKAGDDMLVFRKVLNGN